MGTIKSNGFRIAHTDITEKNVLYNNETQLFYLIDWGMSTDFNNSLWPFAYGSWHVFSPFGYSLRTKVQNYFVKGKQSEMDWRYGHLNDLYGIHCLVLDFLAVWQNGMVPGHLKQSLFVSRRTAMMNSKSIERCRHYIDEYWQEIYPLLCNTWEVRSRELKKWRYVSFGHEFLNDIIHDAIETIV